MPQIRRVNLYMETNKMQTQMETETETLGMFLYKLNGFELIEVAHRLKWFAADSDDPNEAAAGQDWDDEDFLKETDVFDDHNFRQKFMDEIKPDAAKAIGLHPDRFTLELWQVLAFQGFMGAVEFRVTLKP